MPPRFTRNSDRPRASDRTMVDTEDTRTRLQRFPTRSASSPSADEPHGWQQARAKPLERIGGHTYYSGLDVEKQSRSGQSGAFFLTFLFIELIDSPGEPVLQLPAARKSVIFIIITQMCLRFVVPK